MVLLGTFLLISRNPRVKLYHKDAGRNGLADLEAGIPQGHIFVMKRSILSCLRILSIFSPTDATTKTIGVRLACHYDSSSIQAL